MARTKGARTVNRKEEWTGDVAEFVELTQQVRSALLQSNPQADDGLKTAGEMLECWFDAMPKDVEKWLKHNTGFVKVGG